MKVLNKNIALYIEVPTINPKEITRFLDTCINSETFRNNPNIKISLLNQCNNLNLEDYQKKLHNKLFIKSVDKISKVLLDNEELIPFAKIRYITHEISMSVCDNSVFNIALIVDDDLEFSDKSFENYIVSANLYYVFYNTISGIYHTAMKLPKGSEVFNYKDYYSYTSIHGNLESGCGIMLSFDILDKISPDCYNLLGCGEDVMYCYHAATFNPLLVTYNVAKETKVNYPTGLEWSKRAKVNKSYSIRWLRKTKGTMQNYLNKQFGFTNHNYHWNDNNNPFRIEVNEKYFNLIK